MRSAITPDTSQHTSTTSAKLTGPTAWRKDFLFIDSRIRLTFICNKVNRCSAPALSRCWGGGMSAAAIWDSSVEALGIRPSQSLCLDFNRQTAQRHPILRFGVCHQVS